MKEKKRICILHHTGLMGGGTKSFLDLIVMLKEDFQIVACIPSGAEELERKVADMDVEVAKIKSPFPILPRYSGGPVLLSRTMLKEVLNWRKKREFCREIEEYEPDVILFNSIVTIFSAPYFSEKIKKICFVRETMVHPFSLRLFAKILKNHVSLTCFLAEAERNKFKLKKEKTVIIPDSLPEEEIQKMDSQEARKRLSLQEGSFYVLFMGGDLRIKGGRVLLSAMAELGKEYHLLLGGDFREEELERSFVWKDMFSPMKLVENIRLKRAYHKAKEKSNVTLLGFRDSIAEPMCASDVVVFPAIKAHQPRPCIEAGYYGKPVIITDFKETREYFKEGYNAFVFQNKKKKDLAEKIRYLKSEETLLKKMGKNNQKESEEKHNFSKINQRLKACLIKEI